MRGWRQVGLGAIPISVVVFVLLVLLHAFSGCGRVIVSMAFIAFVMPMRMNMLMLVGVH